MTATALYVRKYYVSLEINVQETGAQLLRQESQCQSLHLFLTSGRHLPASCRNTMRSRDQDTNTGLLLICSDPLEVGMSDAIFDPFLSIY